MPSSRSTTGAHKSSLHTTGLRTNTTPRAHFSTAGDPGSQSYGRAATSMAALRNLSGNQMPSHPQHFNNSLPKGSSEQGLLIQGMKQKRKETCHDTGEERDTSGERGRCSLSHHWHQWLSMINSRPHSAGLCNWPILHSCFASYSCHKD